MLPPQMELRLRVATTALVVLIALWEGASCQADFGDDDMDMMQAKCERMNNLKDPLLMFSVILSRAPKFMSCFCFSLQIRDENLAQRNRANGSFKENDSRLFPDES